MSTYTQEFIEAVKRTQKYGLIVPAHKIDESKRWLDAKAQSEFPSVMENGVGDIDIGNVVAQCFAINYKLAPVVSDWLGCDAIYTLGWIDDGTDKGMFRFDDHFIADRLRTNYPLAPTNMHAWLTLPSMEILDITLNTSIGYIQNKPEMLGSVIARHASRMKGLSYKPMLVGDDFLFKAKIFRFFPIVNDSVHANR